MKIAFTTKGTEWESLMDARFGRTEFFLLYDEENDSFIHFDNRDVENDAHGAGPKTAQKLFELQAQVLITGNGPGGNAATVLEKAGIKIYTGAGEMTVKDAYNALKNNELKEF
ncbi:MAG: NifB/NifX family molybdenum-iron cluster-binding protein [Bacteroidales bacterium]|nr:NifB/NifX family molybdenum-iron cluster-binding protein [Bacteroidales bacterium]MBN2758415.1 NifB/NifX family molybdenum-iron cluster-binding protein [Bacteroidales bacterium]